MKPPKDAVCVCGHWSEEHQEDAIGLYACTSCEHIVDCPTFQFSPELNTAEEIGARGGRHWQQPCYCAMCADDVIHHRDTEGYSCKGDDYTCLSCGNAFSSPKWTEVYTSPACDHCLAEMPSMTAVPSPG